MNSATIFQEEISIICVFSLLADPHLSALGKSLLAGCMLLSKLEIYTDIILFIPEFWENKIPDRSNFNFNLYGIEYRTLTDFLGNARGQRV